MRKNTTDKHCFIFHVQRSIPLQFVLVGFGAKRNTFNLNVETVKAVKGAVFVSGGCFTSDHFFTVREEEKEKIHWLSNKNNFFSNKQTCK